MYGGGGHEIFVNGHPKGRPKETSENTGPSWGKRVGSERGTVRTRDMTANHKGKAFLDPKKGTARGK